jgi:hypothetical protein
MCVSNDRCLSNVIPTYFTSLDSVNLTPLSFILKLGIEVLIFLKKISSVLVVFSDILFARRHWLRDFRSVFRFLTMFLFLFCSLFLIEYRRLVSSAKCRTVECLMQVWRSFIYIKNNRGPKTDPCGTPCLVYVDSDVIPLMETHCLLFVRYDLNQSFAKPLIP